MGNKFTNTYSLEHQLNLIRSHLRLLGRLQSVVLKMDPKITQLHMLLCSKNYDLYIKAVRQCAKYNSKLRLFKTPAVESTLRTLIKKCIVIWMAECIKMGRRDLKREAKEFLNLFNADFPTSVSKTVMENQLIQKRSQDTVLPSQRDINKLYEHLRKTCDKAVTRLEEKFDLKTWKTLNEATLVQIQVFNRKRAGEIERMNLTDFFNRTTIKTDENSDLFGKLDKNAQSKAAKYTRVTIRGKLKRTVPALLDNSLV